MPARRTDGDAAAPERVGGSAPDVRPRVLARPRLRLPCTQDIFEDFLREIQPRYTVQTYNLLSHNCNNFSDEVLQFLTGSELPSSIVNLPTEVMDSPLGAMIAPLLSSFEAALNRPGDSSFG